MSRKSVSFSELARLKGVTRGAVSRAIKGPLAPAVISVGHRLGRVDLDHPSARKWLGKAAPKPTERRLLVLVENGLTAEDVARETGEPLAEVQKAFEKRLKSARVPPGHLSATEFAARAGAPLDEIVAACADGALTAAVMPSGRISLAHRASLLFMANRPFPRDPKGDPILPEIDGDGYLAAACVGEQIDLHHPVALAFEARLTGSAPKVPKSA